MCTAVSFLTKDHYFGRNLDLEYSYDESIVITPRNFPLPFRKKLTLQKHYAMIGTAYLKNNYPLYYDAVNEVGLGIAGLNFPLYANYKPAVTKKDNITPFEFIPWILGQCASVAKARFLLSNINLLDEAFSNELPLSPLHWLISDKTCSIVVESLKEGIKIYENPAGVLTNSPSFDMQLFHLNNYMHLSNSFPKNHFSQKLAFQTYSNGMGALGMPGDWSSQSRFIKASFVKMNSDCAATETNSVNQFFHILGSVAHPRGCVLMEDNSYEITVYSNCCNTTKGIYYYKTYNNSQITAVDMYKENLDLTELISYPMLETPQIHWQNEKKPH